MTKEQDNVLDYINKVTNNRFQNDWTEKIEALEARVKELEGKNRKLKKAVNKYFPYILMWNEVRGASDEFYDKFSCLSESMEELEEEYLVFKEVNNES